MLADRTRFALRAAVLAIGLPLVSGLEQGASGQEAKKEPVKNRILNVKFGGTLTPDVVLVQLYQEGKLLREKEVSSATGSVLPKSVAWAKLAPGRYEVHFTGKGYARSLKKVFLSEEDDEESTIVIEMDREKSYESGGDGPTLHALADDVKKLKEEVARLRGAK